MNTRKNKKSKQKIKTAKNKKLIYSNSDYKSGDGMLTTVWGPSMWHYMHIMSFNYPITPTLENKKHYREFIINLQYTLPCKYCRINLTKNLKQLPITMSTMKNRESFSRYVYDLHELINKMLKKTSHLSYDDVRDRYEHFRARCTMGVYPHKPPLRGTLTSLQSQVIAEKGTEKEPEKEAEKEPEKEAEKGTKGGLMGVNPHTHTHKKGCTEPLYGKKSKCIIKIVPQDDKSDTFQMDKKCIKSKK
jgi:hypothetical protein